MSLHFLGMFNFREANVPVGDFPLCKVACSFSSLPFPMNDVVVSVAMMFLCSFVGRREGSKGERGGLGMGRRGEESSSRVMTLAPTTRNGERRPPFAAAAAAVNNVL